MASKEYQRAWRAKRKAAGLSYLGGQMSKEWHQEYDKYYLQRAEVRARRNERTKALTRNPVERAKYVCRWALNNAIRDGRITRQPCEVCGKKAHGHHDNYAKPFEVKWLCALHHRNLHLTKRRLQRKEQTL